MTNAKRDQNHVTGQLGAKIGDLDALTPFVIDDATGRLLVQADIDMASEGIATQENQTNGNQKTQINGVNENSVATVASFDNAANLKVNSFPYTYAIAEGDILGHTALLKFGSRTLVAANTSSTTWEGPTARYVYMSSAQQLKVSSSSVNDTLAGTGARTLFIQGLDANYLEISETINLNGTTVVTTALSYLRIYRAFVLQSGVFGNSNLGIITITNNAATLTQAIINVDDGQTLMAIWTVPAGKVAYITNISFSSDTNKGARFSLHTRLNGGLIYAWLIKYSAFIFSGNIQAPFNIPLQIPEKTDIEMRVTTPAAAGVTSIGGTFELWYENV